MTRIKDQKDYTKALRTQAIRWINTPDPKSINDYKFHILKKEFEDSLQVEVTAMAKDIIYDAVLEVNNTHLRETKKGRPWVKGW